MKKARLPDDEQPKKEYTADEIEDLAYNGAPLPEDLSTGETLLFLMFRSLYEYARQTHMDPEQGRREKLRILQQCKRHLLDDLYVKYVADLNMNTEQARTAYRKAKTKEEALAAADRLVEAIEHIPVVRPYEEEST